MWRVTVNLYYLASVIVMAISAVAIEAWPHFVGVICGPAAAVVFMLGERSGREKMKNNA